MPQPTCYEPSYSQPMDRESLRKLKHEIRTPVNHILGYSELIMEAADDAGDAAMATLARDIHQRGRQLASALEKNLLLPAVETDGDVMAPLREGVSPIIQEILTIAFLNPQLPALSSYSEDLARIRSAATQLMTLVNPDHPASSD
jgi:signal transduction histidine kinase